MFQSDGKNTHPFSHLLIHLFTHSLNECLFSSAVEADDFNVYLVQTEGEITQYNPNTQRYVSTVSTVSSVQCLQCLQCSVYNIYSVQCLVSTPCTLQHSPPRTPHGIPVIQIQLKPRVIGTTQISNFRFNQNLVPTLVLLGIQLGPLIGPRFMNAHRTSRNRGNLVKNNIIHH